MRLMKTPRSVDLSITRQCNLRCAYCSHFGSASEVGEDLPTSQWMRFFEELERSAVMDITLQGGEPFYRDDLMALIRSIVTHRMRFRILSNGTLVTDEIASFLKQTNRCDGVQVSIDGIDSESHDAFRGKGVLHKAVRGIETLQRYHVPVDARVTVHRKNVDHLEKTAQYLLEELGLPSFSTNAASYMGLCREHSKEVQLNTAERSHAIKILHQLRQTYPGRIHASAGPLANAEIWMEMVQAHEKGYPGFEGGGCLTGCNGPMTTIAVRADGVLIPCSQLSHVELGRINNDNLQEVWQCHPQLQRLRERYALPLSDFEFCQGCAYTKYCTGNCPALAYTICGEENHPSPDACLRKYLAEGGILPNSNP